MDFGEAIKHDVAFKTLNIRHLVDVSPSTVSIAKEIRYCVIAVCVSWASISVFRSWMAQRRAVN